MKNHYGLILLALLAFLGYRWLTRKKDSPAPIEKPVVRPAPTPEPTTTAPAATPSNWPNAQPGYSNAPDTSTVETPALTVPTYEPSTTGGSGASYTAAYNGPGYGEVNNDSMSDNRLSPVTIAYLERVSPGLREAYLAETDPGAKAKDLQLLQYYITNPADFGGF